MHLHYEKGGRPGERPLVVGPVPAAPGCLLRLRGLLSTAAGLSALIAAAQVLVMGYLVGEGALLPAVSPWTIASSYLVGSMATVLAFHRVMY